MNNRSQRLLQEIETGALDQKTPIGDLLRKVIALGGQARSMEMRDWASRELDGYGPDDELPPYRRLKTAPLCVDMINLRLSHKGQMISWMQLPEAVRERIANEVVLRWRIVEIEHMSRQSRPDEPFRLSPPNATWAVAIMNSDGKQSGQVTDLYWAVSPVLLIGVVDQVRTTLTKMTAEIRATMPDNAESVSAAVATDSLHFAVTGERSKVTVTAPQGGSTVTTAPAESRYWVRIAAGVVIGLLTIAGVVFALMQAQGWRF